MKRFALRLLPYLALLAGIAYSTATLTPKDARAAVNPYVLQYVLGQALPASGGGCTSGCTFAGTTTTAALSATTIAASGAITSSVASGSTAIDMLTGARLRLSTAHAAWLTSNGAGTWTLTGAFLEITNGALSDTFRSLGSGHTASFLGEQTDGAAAIGAIIGQRSATLANATAKIVSVQNNSVEKASINKDGAPRWNSSNVAQPTCDSTIRGREWFFEGGAGVTDRWEICAKDAADAYAWHVAY